MSGDNRGWSGRMVRKTVNAVLEAYGTVCHLCGGEDADSADHVIPRSKGGGHGLANLRPAHASCNRARGDMDLTEWFALHPLPTRPALAPSRKW